MATKRKDFTQIAFDVVQRATGEVTAPAPSKKQESGRKGGLKGGASRAIVLTPEQRSEIARVAAQARWKKA
ncbi:MAG: histone H1 [Pseudomonadota bacterium]